MEIAEEKNEHMATRELEAAEALARLARCSGELEIPGRKLVKMPADQAISFQLPSGNKSTMVESAFNTEETVRLAADYQSKIASRLRQNVIEAEKESQRLRRVLANRESARQTIRRKQAMHLELNRKAAEFLEENKKLKKEKELAAEEYTTLKSRNEFLKVQMIKLKKAEPRIMQEELKSSQAEIVLPSSNAFKLQHAFSLDVTSSSRFPIQYRDIPFFHHGRDICMGIAGPENHFVVLPVPCVLPFHSQKTTSHSHSDTSERELETSLTHQCGTSSSETLLTKGNHQLSSTLNMRTEPLKCTRAMSTGSVYAAGFISPADGRDHYTGPHPETLFAPETWKCVGPLESLGSNKDSWRRNL